MSVLYLFLYFYYRIQGMSHYDMPSFMPLRSLTHHFRDPPVGSNKDATFVAFIVFATINSCYSVTWDVLMDWNLFKRNSKYPLLRNELAYKDHVWVGRCSYIAFMLTSFSLADAGMIVLVLLLRSCYEFDWTFHVVYLSRAWSKRSPERLHRSTHRDCSTLSMERELAQ